MLNPLLGTMKEVMRIPRLKVLSSTSMKEAAEGNTLLSVEQVPSQGEEEQFGQEQMHRQRICRKSVPLFYVRLGSRRC